MAKCILNGKVLINGIDVSGYVISVNTSNTVTQLPTASVEFAITSITTEDNELVYRLGELPDRPD